MEERGEARRERGERTEDRRKPKGRGMDIEREALGGESVAPSSERGDTSAPIPPKDSSASNLKLQSTQERQAAATISDHPTNTNTNTNTNNPSSPSQQPTANVQRRRRRRVRLACGMVSACCLERHSENPPYLHFRRSKNEFRCRCIWGPGLFFGGAPRHQLVVVLDTQLGDSVADYSCS